MKLTVRQRLLLLALLPASLLAMVLAAYFTYEGVSSLDHQLRQRGLEAVRYLAPLSEYAVLSGQLDSIQSQVQAVTRQQSVKAVLVVGRDGRILAVGGRVSLSADDLRRPIAEPLLVASGESWLGFAAPIQRSVLDVDELFNQEQVKPNSPRNEVVGQVFVEMDASEVFAQQRMLLLRGMLILLTGLVLAAVYAVRVANRAARPLLELVAAVGEMSTGKYETRVEENSVGEVGVLQHGFNEMVGHIAATHRDMQSRIEEATAHLAFQARHDALTNLINRREFEARLELAINAVETGGIEVTVLFLDLDRFKVVNDNSGHLAGDELLRQISRLFTGRLREKDTLARIGGDEFAVILPDCSQEAARRVAEDLCALAAGYRFIWQEQAYSIGVSIGLVKVSGGMHGINDVISAGDLACYAAKEAGRNRVHVHSSLNLPERAPGGERWREKIEVALRDHRLRALVTPIRPISPAVAGNMVAELSVSLEERGSAQIGSGLFMDMAERYGLAQAVDEQVLERALAALARVDARSGAGMPMLMVHLSPATLRGRDGVQRIVAALQHWRYCGRGLCLALSEDTVIRNIAEAGVLCAAMREHGCSIALTDFGGWLASFNHLDVVLPNIIRINHGLTRDLTRQRSAVPLVRAIQDIAEDRGVYTLAEGIDQPEMLVAARELGIHYAQGLAVAPVEPLEAWIEGEVLRSVS